MRQRRITSEIRGVIYDVDDTLLNNQPDDQPLHNLHQQARLVALHTVAREHEELTPLLGVTAEDNFGAFARAPEHTVAGALWTVMHDAGVIDDIYDPKHPYIQEMLAIKNTAYAELLATYGRPITGAIEFVRDLSRQYNLGDYNGVASTATRPDVLTFLGMTGLNDLIPYHHVIAYEDVERPKPDPEGFNKAFLSLDLPERYRSRVFAFEDDPRGMLAARKAGLAVCAITTRYTREFLQTVEAKPDFIADNYAEFRRLFSLPCLPE